jgi:hypothetical protein
MARTAIEYLEPLEGRAAVDQAPTRAPKLELVRAVGDGDGHRRSGLSEVLEGIAAGEASTLVVRRLGALAGSLRELVALLDWLAAAGADLVALDVGLDSGSASGRAMVSLLREIERWEREPALGRAPRGRPGLAVRSPALGERIATMRERGLSLQAIADTLNADGEPTQRGGARWRPSSVQAALGYRRPRPPVPGAPPPPPPRASHRHPPLPHRPPDGPRRPPSHSGR